MRAIRIRAATLAITALLCAPLPAHAVITNGANARDILGQFVAQDSDATPHYTKGCPDNGPSAIGFRHPEGVTMDTVHHRMFVADCGNNRVLVFTLDSNNAIASKTPANVLGQTSLTSCASGPIAGVTQSTMYCPVGLAYDGTNDRLFVSDNENQRILIFDTTAITDGENAANVLGQANFTDNNGGAGSEKLHYPAHLAFDAANNRLFAADIGNNRVLVFDVAAITDGEDAVKVLGQTNFVNSGVATTQSGMDGPYGLAYDSVNNRLFVSEISNNRVLVFDVAAITDGENAINVLGQTNFTNGGGATTQSGLDQPYGLALDSGNNRLFVGDTWNNRIMVFNVAAITNGENAVNVLGNDVFDDIRWNVSQDSVDQVNGLAFDATNNRLLALDAARNRLMVFDTATITDGEDAVDLVGQYASLTSTATPDYDQYGENNYDLPNALGFDEPQDAVLDAAHHRLFVTDATNNRVLVYNLNTDNSLPDRIADNVLGQFDLWSFSWLYSDEGGMNYPAGLSYDAVHDRLFVPDCYYYTSRVLVFDTASITDGEDAVKVLGQPNFSTFDNAGTTQARMSSPCGSAYDAVNDRLYVADSDNNRVLVYDVASITNGENAINVLGQTNFTNNGAATSQSRMRIPVRVAFDPVNARLFVGDTDNNRVLVYDVASITNGENAANVLGQTNFTNNGNATSQSRMYYPVGVSYDPTNNRLFVGDTDNNRVLVFNTAKISNGMNADKVLGQSDFTSNGRATTQSGMWAPVGLQYEPGSGRLFVPDWGNNRVLIFEGDTNSTRAQWDFIDYK